MSVAPGAKVNRIGLTAADYKGSKSTLCPGCGHDAITNSIIQAAYEAGLEQHRVAKLSGIGCSSKTPAYFRIARRRHHKQTNKPCLLGWLRSGSERGEDQPAKQTSKLTAFHC